MFGRIEILCSTGTPRTLVDDAKNDALTEAHGSGEGTPADVLGIQSLCEIEILLVPRRREHRFRPELHACVLLHKAALGYRYRCQCLSRQSVSESCWDEKNNAKFGFEIINKIMVTHLRSGNDIYKDSTGRDVKKVVSRGVFF